MNPHRWSTEYEHPGNDFTMSEFLNEHLGEDNVIIMIDGSYAEIETPNGKIYEVHASGDGDFKNHRIDFIKKPQVQEG